MSQQLTNLTTSFYLTAKTEPAKINFETALTQAIDETFTTFGQNVKQATYNYIENQHAIKKEQIPSMIEGFTSAIESIFGDAAGLLELKIMEKLQSKAPDFIYKAKRREVFFADYLNELKRHLDWQCLLPNV